MPFGGLRRWTGSLAIPALVTAGAILSVVLFVFLQVQARDATRSLLERTAEQYRQALQERLDDSVFVLTALHGLASRAPDLTQPALALEADPLLALAPGVTAVGWASRATPEGSLRLGLRHPAAGPGAEPAVGDRPGEADAMERACATGAMAAAPPSGDRLRLFLAVHRPPPAPGEPAGCATVDGYLVAEVSVSGMVALAVAALPAPRPDVLVLGVAADGGAGGGLGGGRRVLAASGVAPGASAPDDRWTMVTRDLPVGGQRWEVAVPFAGGLPVPGAGAAWGALAIGLLLTGLLAAHLLREERARAMLQAEARARAAMARMLRESEERFRLALRYSHVSVFSQDRELRYVWVYNPQLPVPAERFIGRRHAELFPPDEAACLDAIKRRAMDLGIGARQEVALTAGGHEVVVDLVVEPLRDDTGAVTGVICASIDITESTRIKKALADARAEAERADRAKSRFLAAASHDLRQPFQAMSLFHHILMAKLTDDGQREIADKLGEALGAGNALLTALLDTSALEVGNVTPRFVSFPIAAIAERLANEFSDQTAQKGLRFHLAVTAATVQSDPILLERILRNLLVNALRYTRQGGILLGCRRRGDRLSIEVWDTGPGIPPDQMESIFEDFYRGAADRGDGGRGLGLGLSIVRRTAQVLDHPVAVRSRVGRGTVFTVSVPVVAPDGPEETPPPGEGAAAPRPAGVRARRAASKLAT